MSQLISLSQPLDPASTQPRIGGGALLPEGIAWPHSPKREPLVLVASIPSALVNELPGFSLPAGTFLSVFTTYHKADYFLDGITYMGTAEELAALRAGSTRVLLHAEGKARNEAAHTVPARRIDLTPLDAPEEATHTGSRWAGIPGLLQQEALALPGLRYVLQLYAADFPEEFEDLFYLTDAVGYLYVKPEVTPQDGEAGLFFVQVT